jgi:purine-binding chemotaxis protein CheW
MKKAARGSRTLDWAKAKERLARAAASLDEASRPSPERAAAILESRARALARRPDAASGTAGRMQVVVFALGGERYAIETRHVLEVFHLTALAPLPSVPPFIAGVTNRRGEILAVVDLRHFFNLPAPPLSDLSRVLVLGRGDDAELGILADEAREVLELPIEALGDPPPTSPPIGRTYVRGVTPDACIVLDGESLLTDSRLVIDTYGGPDTRPAISPDG